MLSNDGEIMRVLSSLMRWRTGSALKIWRRKVIFYQYSAEEKEEEENSFMQHSVVNMADSKHIGYCQKGDLIHHHYCQ